MMHMSKSCHDDEKEIIDVPKPSPTLSFQTTDMDPPSKRESAKKKRLPKTRIMNLALETMS